MSRRHTLLLNIYFVAVFAGIGGLQMFRVNAGILTNYGADLLAPPYMYLALRGGRFRLRSLAALATVLGGCCLWEWMQRYDLGGTPLGVTRGRFDPLDLLSYTVGLLVSYVVDDAGCAREGSCRALSRPPNPASADGRRTIRCHRRSRWPQVPRAA